MSKLSYLSQVALFLLIASCSVSLSAETMVDFALNEYTLAAQSGNLHRYNKACDLLTEAAKSADEIDAKLCRQTALNVRPKHNHGRRIAAGLIAFPNPLAMINTAVHARSTRGDTTPCLVTSTLASFGAGIVTIGATAATAATIVIANAAATTTALGATLGVSSSTNGTLDPRIATGMRFAVTEGGDLSIKSGVLAVALLSSATGLWASIYLNSKASKEKTAFDDAHQSLIRSLDAAMCKHQSPDIHEKSPVSAA
jgi:hypothetical protein